MGNPEDHVMALCTETASECHFGASGRGSYVTDAWGGVDLRLLPVSCEEVSKDGFKDASKEYRERAWK